MHLSTLLSIYKVSLCQSGNCQSVQSEERQVGLRTSSWTLDIFVISKPKWLKFGLHPGTFFKMFGHAKFQLSISCTHRAMKLLVDESVISVKLSDFSGYLSITLKVQVIGS